MEIFGIIEEVIDKSKPHFKNIIVVVYDSVSNLKWGIQFRKQLAGTAKAFRKGDRVKVSLYNDVRADNHNNYYNNVIAKKVERI